LKAFEDSGMVMSGINPETGLVEIIELPNHPWFVGVQFHPELKSTVSHPHPLFVGLVKAALQHKQVKELADEGKTQKNIISYS
jgi:CTP synthase